jgi:hypothetical protein
VRAGFVVLCLAAALPCAAQPQVANGRVVERDAAGGLDPAVREIVASSAEPAWIAWQVPSVEGRWVTCCCGNARNDRKTARLEPPASVFVFLRAEAGAAGRVRVFGEECELDAGGRTVTWLTGVSPAQSTSFLAALAGQSGVPRRAATGALSALAHHGNAEAVGALLRLARSAPDARVRGEALFWVAQRAGDRAAAAITEAIAGDPEAEVRKRAVFALSQLPAGEGVPRLIDLARTNRHPAVRKQAMFWLGQSKDPRALAFFEEVLLK